MTTSRLLLEIKGSIATVTVNRPEARNAMTWAMYDALFDACERVDAEDAVRVFVLKGAGGQAFVSGTDIGEFTTFESRQDGISYEQRLDRVIDRLERVTKPTVAQVEGVAAGGGCLMALACDLRVCTRQARFGVPIARTLGNCLSAASTARLVDLIGPARTKDLLITGRLIDAAEAMSLGLVTRIAEPSEIEASVHELVTTIASHAPLTIRAAKEMVRRTQVERRLNAAEAEDLIALCYSSADFKEGVAAFLAKRQPRFMGR